MTKKLYLPFLMAMVVALMTSCSKKMGELSSDYFTVTPQVLEAVGGKVPATINGKFPEKYFNKKAVVEVTPVLKWKNDLMPDKMRACERGWMPMSCSPEAKCCKSSRVVSRIAIPSPSRKCSSFCKSVW